MFSVLRTVFQFSRRLNTQVFDTMTNKQLATPELVRKVLIKPIHMHSMVSQVSLYHKKRVKHFMRSCFSQKKTKVFKRVNKIKQKYYSGILGIQLPMVLTKKTQRCITKAGSFDNYILCTKPIDLDSKKGEYLRQLMLRKINDPEYRIPYIIGSKPKKRVRHYRMVEARRQAKLLIIPKEWKQTYQTFQKAFGKNVDELNQQDYAKYQELESLRRKVGDQVEQNHPLLVELQKKMGNQPSKQEEEILDQMSAEAKDQYLNHTSIKYKEDIRKKYQKRKLQHQNTSLKYREALIKFRSLQHNQNR